MSVHILHLRLENKKKEKKEQASDQMKVSSVEVPSTSVKGGKALKVKKLNISRRHLEAFADDVMVSDVWRSWTF